MANFRVPIIIIMRIGVGVTTWYLELGYFFHGLFEFLSIQSFLVKEVVPEAKRWYLKQRDGIWNKEVVFETKRWYLKQRGGIWNKEVVSEPMKGRLTKSTTAWRLTRDHRHRWKSSWEEWSCERCLCPLATGRTWPSLDIQDLIVMLILSMMMTVMIYVSWWSVCVFFAVLSLPMKSIVSCGRACLSVCYALSFWAERWRHKARHWENHQMYPPELAMRLRIIRFYAELRLCVLDICIYALIFFRSEWFLCGFMQLCAHVSAHIFPIRIVYSELI